MGIIRTWGGRGQVAAFNHQRQGGHCYHNRQQKQTTASETNGHWPVDHGVPRGRTYRKPTKFFLTLYQQKISMSSKQKFN